MGVSGIYRIVRNGRRGKLLLTCASVVPTFISSIIYENHLDGIKFSFFFLAPNTRRRIDFSMGALRDFRMTHVLSQRVVHNLQNSPIHERVRKLLLPVCIRCSISSIICENHFVANKFSFFFLAANTRRLNDFSRELYPISR